MIFFNIYYLVQNVFVRIFPLICTSIINQNALCNKCVIQYTILYRSFQLVFNSKTFEFYPETTQISFLKNKTGMKHTYSDCTRTKVYLKLICTFQAENTMSIRSASKESVLGTSVMFTFEIFSGRKVNYTSTIIWVIILLTLQNCDAEILKRV